MTSTHQAPHLMISFRPRVEQFLQFPKRLRFISETVFKSSTHLGITIQRGIGRLRGRLGTGLR